jgi:hypothetical protein
MMRTLVQVAAMVLAVAAASSSPAASQSYVTVVNGDGLPVIGLGSEDFSMRDGSVRRGVLAAEPATAPLAVAVVLHGWTREETTDLARAVASMTRTLHARDSAHEVGVVTARATGASPWTPSHDEASIREAIAAALAAKPAPLVDTLVGAVASLDQATTDRRIVLGLLRRVAEPAGADLYRLTDATIRSRVALWTVEVAGVPATSRAIDDALAAAAASGGALRRTVGRDWIGEAVDRFAALWLSQYVVTFEWPDPMLSQIAIATRHSRGDVLAPVWQR